MATNEIEIEVILNSSDAEEGLASLEESGEALGETFSGVGTAVTAMGGEVNEQMGAVGESFGAVSESVMGLSDAIKGSGGSFLSLIGPIGLVVVALIEAHKAMEDFFGVSQEREIKLKAYELSMAELTVIIEELAAAQVELNDQQIEELRVISQSAKNKIEEAQLIRENTKGIQEQIIAIESRREAYIKEMAAIGGNMSGALQKGLLFERGMREFHMRRTLESDAEKLAVLQERIAAAHAKANGLVKDGRKEMSDLEALKEKHMKRGVKAIKERARLEANMVTEAQIQELQSQEQTEETKRKIAVLSAQRRFREIQELEDVSQDVKDRAVIAGTKALKHTLAQIAEDERKAQKLRAKQAEAIRVMAAAKRLAEEQKTQAELARIQRAEIEHARLNGASRLDILKRQETMELELVGDNERAKQAIRLEFANKRTAVEQEAQKRREERARKEAEEANRLADEERKLAQQRQAFIMESMEFDLRMQEEGIDRELALLEFRFEREMRLREHSEEEITELTRRYSIERMKMAQANAEQGMQALLRSLNSMGESIQRGVGGAVFDSLTSVKTESKEAFKQLSEDFREEERRIKESSENAAFVNQQMTELQANYAREREKIRKSEEGAPSRMVGELLTALGKQAAIESLMFLAKSAAAVFVNPPAAGGYLTAAGIMGTAAALAGYAGSELSASGAAASGGGSLSSSSPTGSPQSAPGPQRERAESTAMVFNINFGNSTIYDTKRAAQDAMASEILRTLNRQRRGAPRFAMG